MKAAISITRIIEVEQMSLAELEVKFQEQYDEESGTHTEPEIDWYDLSGGILGCQGEIWSFAILENTP